MPAWSFQDAADPWPSFPFSALLSCAPELREPYETPDLDGPALPAAALATVLENLPQIIDASLWKLITPEAGDDPTVEGFLASPYLADIADFASYTRPQAVDWLAGGLTFTEAFTELLAGSFRAVPFTLGQLRNMCDPCPDAELAAVETRMRKFVDDHHLVWDDDTVWSWAADPDAFGGAAGLFVVAHPEHPMPVAWRGTCGVDY